jgi:hypothetical protein
MKRREFVKAFGGFAFVPLAFVQEKKPDNFTPSLRTLAERKEPFKNGTFHQLIMEHQYDCPPSIELGWAFQDLTEIILDYYQHSDDILKRYDREDIIQECVLICFEKLKRFDPNRGKAFHYFSTIIISLLMQLRPRPRKRKFSELYEKYQEHLRKKNES